MKKFLSIFLTVATVLSMQAFAACGKKHKHAYDEDKWQADATNHWHVCTGDDCDEIADVAAHVYDNACDTDCNVCGATRTTTHTYDDACDTTCNVCGEPRTIDCVETEDWYGSNTYKTKTTLSGAKGAQYVLQLPYSTYEIYVYIPDEEDWQGDRWLVANYDVRIFDENFNELSVDFGEDGSDKMAYAYIVDENEDFEVTYEKWYGKTVYYMFTLKESGEDFTVAVQ